MSIAIYPKHKGKRGQRDIREFSNQVVELMENIVKRLPEKKRWTKTEINQAIEEEYDARSSTRRGRVVSARRKRKSHLLHTEDV